MSRHRAFVGVVAGLVVQVAVAHARPAVMVWGGWGAGRGGQLSTPSEWYDADANLLAREDHYLSLGKGSDLGGGVEWPLAAQMRVRVFASQRQLASQGYALTAPGDYFNPENSKQLHGHIDQLGATLFCAGGHGAVRPYAGLGATVASLTTRTTFTYNRYGDLVTAHLASSYGRSVGFHAVFGASLRTAGGWSPFAEATLEQLSFRQTRLEVLDAKAFGLPLPLDVDPFQDGDQSVLEFHADDINYAAPPVTQASSLSLRAGVRVRL